MVGSGRTMLSRGHNWQKPLKGRAKGHEEQAPCFRSWLESLPASLLTHVVGLSNDRLLNAARLVCISQLWLGFIDAVGLMLLR